MQRLDRFMMARPSLEGEAYHAVAATPRRPKSRHTVSSRPAPTAWQGRASETPAALREPDPGMLLGGPGDGRRRREGFIGEATDRDRDVIRQGARGPKHRKTRIPGRSESRNRARRPCA